MSLIHHVPPEQMTWRARTYLAIKAASSLVIALAIFLRPSDFTADSWRVIRAQFDDNLWVWGVLALLLTTGFAAAAWLGHEVTARVTLIVSAGLLTAWSYGFYTAWRLGGQVTPIGMDFCATLAAIDAVMCAHPLRTPFDRIARNIEAEQRA